MRSTARSRRGKAAKFAHFSDSERRREPARYRDSGVLPALTTDPDRSFRSVIDADGLRTRERLPWLRRRRFTRPVQETLRGWAEQVRLVMRNGRSPLFKELNRMVGACVPERPCRLSACLNCRQAFLGKTADSLARPFRGLDRGHLSAATIVLDVLDDLFEDTLPPTDESAPLPVPERWDDLVRVAANRTARVTRLKLEGRRAIDTALRSCGVVAYRIAGHLEYEFVPTAPILTKSGRRAGNRALTIRDLAQRRGLRLDRLASVAVPHLHVWISARRADGFLSREEIATALQEVFPAPAQALVKQMSAGDFDMNLVRYLRYGAKFKTSFANDEVRQLVAEDATVGRDVKIVRWRFGDILPERASRGTALPPGRRKKKATRISRHLSPRTAGRVEGRRRTSAEKNLDARRRASWGRQVSRLHHV
ncbi:hypothetical protein sos41_14030 [Alphaproteobacteria bacterium SO-S41]|nr:hypothetical protein sos41_14030 [Alphaproteobacteria bacterium SO-S41]